MFEQGQNNVELNRSLIPNTDQLEQRARQIRQLKKGRIDRLLRSVKDISYFKRLFPLVKEEKPGKDLYARITFWQFVIAIYIINLYQYIDARGTQILQNTNQYSYNMTIMILIHVFVMILERYISRTNVRKHNKSLDAKKLLDEKKISQQQTGGAITQAFQTNKTARTQIKFVQKPSALKVVDEEKAYDELL